MKIKLNSTTSIDLDKLIESRLLVQANSGGGKSWAIRRIIEQAFGHVQIIVLDPEGEFSNLRSKYDFIYIGKGGDASAEPRSAALLAKRLLELKASAIIDLYELAPQDRKHFVRLFCEAMVNAPKELWHDTLIIIDEAHVFAPEKGESEALGPVIDLATRGRKRGYCVVLATQRLPKLNKDATAECNNKLIGRASQDIDRKRAAEELGFTTRDQVISLRDLLPGEFYVFGPAIGRDVTRTTIGDVQVKPAKRGLSRQSPPPPSAHVKKILAKLADLPQEAQEERNTIQGLKTALRAAEGKITSLERELNDPRANTKSVEQAFKDIEKRILIEQVRPLAERFNKISKAMMDIAALTKPFAVVTNIVVPTRDDAPLISTAHDPGFYARTMSAKEKAAGSGERTVLIALAEQGMTGMSREHITVQTSYKRSTRDAYIQRLLQKDYIKVGIVDGASRIWISDRGLDFLGNDYVPLPTGQALREHLQQTLPEGEARILRELIGEGQSVSRDWLTQETGYKRSTRDAYIQRLVSRQLVIIESAGMVKVSPHVMK